MDGYGIYYFAGGDTLIGRWKDGVQDGPCVYTGIEGVRREEKWSKGVREWGSGVVREKDSGGARTAAVLVLEEMVRVEEKEAEFERREAARREEDERRREREEVERQRRLLHEQEEREEKERIAQHLSQHILDDFKPLSPTSPPATDTAHAAPPSSDTIASAPPDALSSSPDASDHLRLDMNGTGEQSAESGRETPTAVLHGDESDKSGVNNGDTPTAVLSHSPEKPPLDDVEQPQLPTG